MISTIPSTNAEHLKTKLCAELRNFDSLATIFYHIISGNISVQAHDYYQQILNFEQ